MSQEGHGSNAPNIVVFGQTGTGKSSLINMLAGRDVAKVSSQVVWGGTEAAEGHRITKENRTYTFWDTCGMDEGGEGTVPPKAIESLINLVANISVSLILYCQCVRSLRSDVVRVNYDLFCGLICEGKVPMVLVVTGLEQEEDMDQWWTKNGDVVKRLGLHFEGHACVTTIKGRNGMYQKEYQQSRNKVWRLVEFHCNPPSWTLTQEWHAKVRDRIEVYLKEYNLRTGKERKALPKLSPIKHNVIVFGEPGSGKSSLVHMIVGQYTAEESKSNKSASSTFEHKCYETRIGCFPCRIHDTSGLQVDKGDKGRVLHWKVIQGLYTLIRQLDGISLLIFCMRGRIKDSTSVNWLLFFDAICDKKVPIVVVSTGGEVEDDMQSAEAQLRDAALQRYSLVPKEVAYVVSTLGKNREYEDKYMRSQQRVRNLIGKHRRDEPWSQEKGEWFAQLYQSRTFSSRLAKGAGALIAELGKHGNLRQDRDINTLMKTLTKAENQIPRKGL